MFFCFKVLRNLIIYWILICSDSKSTVRYQKESSAPLSTVVYKYILISNTWHAYYYPCLVYKILIKTNIKINNETTTPIDQKSLLRKLTVYAYY